jgi:hypothetical protein
MSYDTVGFQPSRKAAAMDQDGFYRAEQAYIDAELELENAREALDDAYLACKATEDAYDAAIKRYNAASLNVHEKAK